MSTATMTSKGQLTVPKEVREDLDLKPGSKVMFVKLPNRQYRLVARTGTVEDFIGVLHDPSRAPLSIEQLNDAIAEGGAASGLHGIQ